MRKVSEDEQITKVNSLLTFHGGFNADADGL